MPIQVRLTTPNAEQMGGVAIVNALREHSDEIARLIRDQIIARTPEDTGALKDSVSYQTYTSAVTGSREASLVRFYADDTPQIESWGRVYAPYQEGPPLGLPTYTNPPHQMFARIDEDIALIEAWVDQAAGKIEDMQWGEEQRIYGDTL